jgi:hypothetical protein
MREATSPISCRCSCTAVRSAALGDMGQPKRVGHARTTGAAPVSLLVAPELHSPSTAPTRVHA